MSAQKPKKLRLVLPYMNPDGSVYPAGTEVKPASAELASSYLATILESGTVTFQGPPFTFRVVVLKDRAIGVNLHGVTETDI